MTKPLYKMKQILRLVCIALLLIATNTLSVRKETDTSTEILTNAERVWLSQHADELRFAPDPAYAPFEFYDTESASSSGLASDFMLLIEKKLNIRFKRIEAKSFNDILELAKQGKVTVVNAVTKTPERSQYLLFTDPFIEIKNVILTRKSIEKNFSLADLQGYTISMVKGYAITEYMLKYHPSYQYHLASNDLEVLLSISTADSPQTVGILDLATASYLSEKEGVTNLRVAGDTGYNIRLAIGSRKDWPELQVILNKTLHNISKSERDKIHHKWINIETNNIFKTKAFWLTILSILSLFAVTISFVILWSRQLKNQVRLKTESLRIALEELARSELRFRTLFEQAAVGVGQIDSHSGRFVRVNKRYCDILGYTKEELESLSFQEVTHHEDLTLGLEDLNRLLAGEIETFSTEKRYIHKEGNVVWARLTVSGMPSLPEKGLYHIAVVEDITAHKLAELAVIESQRLAAIGEIVSGIAHDFNNVLQGILGNIEVALLQDEVPIKNRARLEAAKGLASDAASRVALLQRFTAKKITQTGYEPIDLNEMVSDVLTQSKPLWKDQMEAKGFVVHVQTNYSAIPKVIGERGNIRSAIYNVVKNSLEAMPNGGQLSIETGRFEAEVFITITDSGCGMTEECARRIFQPFFTTKGFNAGRGLGMSGVIGTMREHKGKVVVEKTAPGEGTKIRMSFPLETTIASELEVNRQSTKSESKLNPLHILWVDDDASIREIAQRYLEKLGHSGNVVSSGKEAISCLDSDRGLYDLLLTDIGMAEMNGWELAHTIRRTHGGKLQIAVLTGWGTDTEKNQIQEGDIDYILGKPVSFAELQALLEKVQHSFVTSNTNSQT